MNNIRFRTPKPKLPYASQRGNIVRHGDCGRYIDMKGGYDYKTGETHREHFLHATKGWRTRRGT